jgi:hypothetical protein
MEGGLAPFFLRPTPWEHGTPSSCHVPPSPSMALQAWHSGAGGLLKGGSEHGTTACGPPRAGSVAPGAWD